MRKFIKRFAKFLWLLPGFLLWASFPPMGEKMDVLFALAPLLWLSRRGDPRRSAKIWFANGIFFWVATLSWMPAIVNNGGPWPLVVLGWGALAAYMALYFAAFGWICAHVWRWVAGEGTACERPYKKYARRLAAILVFEPVLWAGLEIVRSRFMGGFAWNQLGVAMVNAGFGAPVRLGGVYLASALVVLVNGTVASIVERMLEPALPRRILPNGLPEPAIAVAPWIRSCETFVPLAIVWGVFNLAASFAPADASAESSRPVGFALVQRNFPCVFKEKGENPMDVYKRLLANMRPLNPGVVVLAESALCEFGDVESRRASQFADWVRRETGAAVVVAGGARKDSASRLYNSAGVYGSNGVAVYDKVHLVPFGEYIPLDKTIALLQRLAPVGSCTAGELKTVDLSPWGDTGEKVAAGVAICFEDTDSAQMRRLAGMGAQVLVFITNDSWFSGSQEAIQHAWQSTARAIETGLPVVRVGNSGVTGTVLPDGRASWLSVGGEPLVDAEAAMFDLVSPALSARKPVPYVVLGDKPLFLSFMLLIGALILIKYLSYHEKRRKLSL